MTTVILDLRKSIKSVGIEGLSIDRYRPQVEENNKKEGSEDEDESDQEEEIKEHIHNEDEDLFTKLEKHPDEEKLKHEKLQGKEKRFEFDEEGNSDEDSDE